MVRAALGVNIGPLLAGAVVVGLAVGFGAQTLVKDVITGLFYLVADAFCKGEYIQCSGGKGVVEKVSLRSVQLRHHNGPLNTIQIGRQSCGDRVCQFVWCTVSAVTFKKNKYNDDTLKTQR